MEMNLDTLLNQEMLVVLREVEPFALIGLERKENIFILRGYEKRLGIWVEINGIKNCPVRTKNSSLENEKAVIFIPWHHIETILHFPGKSGLEMEQTKSRKIGFRQE